MAKVQIKITDHTGNVKKTLNSRLATAFEAIGAQAMTNAIKLVPVDTGRLKNSLAWATHENNGGGSDPLATPEEHSVYIGTNVEYAAVQEYGDFNHTVGQKHYLRDAAANHVDDYIDIISMILKK